MELSKKFASLSQKHKALAADVKLKRAARQVSLQKIKTTKDELRKTLSSLSARQVELKAKLRGAQLKAQMNGFVVAGKVNPSELTKMDFKALGALPQHAVDVLLASYESRQVSTDVYQYGQSGSSLVKEPTTKAEMAEAIKLQKAGKRISLSDRIVDEKPVDDAKAKLEGEEGEDSKKKINHDDMKDILAEMDEHHAKVGEAMDKLKSLGEETDKMDGEDKKEEEHLSDDEGEDLAKEDDEDGKPKDKKEEK